MPTFPPRFALCLALATVLFAGCGGEGAQGVIAAAHAQPPIPAAHPQAAPLTETDVAMYLDVMRAAAQRVQHPTAADRAMLAKADAITAAANRGEAMAGADPDGALQRAVLWHTQMDVEIAQARHLDTARYQAISERIEDESGELYCDAGARVPDRLLIGHVKEIERLVVIVRNPGPTGSPPIPPACANGDGPA